jgi:hypothetical protein
VVCGSADKGIEGVAIGARRVAAINLLRSEVERLIGRIAEEVREETRQRPAQIDPTRPGQEPALPDHGGGNVDEGRLSLGRIEDGGGPPA